MSRSIVETLDRRRSDKLESNEAQPLQELASDSDDSDIEIELEREPEKDETEEELEQLIFGDSAGFRGGLKSFAKDGGQGEEETGLESLADTDVGLALNKAFIVGAKV